MRFLAIAALMASLTALALAPTRAWGQDPVLDAAPMTWHGVQLGPEQVMEGDYTIDFQTSVFRPDGSPAADAVWLSGWEERPGENGGITRRYHLRFVGRRTVEPGKYGGLGAYKHTVLITHLITARLLIDQAAPEPEAQAKPAPKPPAKPKSVRRP
jgi:hypothetical protein